MNSYRHILLTSDLSPESNEIGLKARRIANASNATLSIAHVINYSPLTNGGGEFAIPLDVSLEESLEQQAKAALAKQGEVLNIPEAQQWILVGNTAAEIVQLVQQIEADLIVIGAHDRQGFSLFLGSTANSIIQTLPCDVLTIRLGDDT